MSNLPVTYNFVISISKKYFCSEVALSQLSRHEHLSIVASFSSNSFSSVYRWEILIDTRYSIMYKYSFNLTATIKIKKY